MSFSFSRHDRPHRWLPRRYQPIIKKESAYAVLLNVAHAEWEVCARWWEDDERFEAWATPATTAEGRAHWSLMEAVNDLKVQHSRQKGGAFRINEYGQVIVPTGQGGAARAYCAGRIKGWLSFEHPDGYAFDLRGESARIGDVWERPVVAFRYTVRNNDRVSFEHQPDNLTKEVKWLSRPQREFASTARAVRGQQGFAVFVNDQRAAVVVCPPKWSARYVGEIDLDDWFEEEPCS